MTSSWQPEERMVVEQQRRAPVSATHLVATYAHGARLPDNVAKGPLHLVVEATNADGNLAPWFHDDWFTELIGRFADDFVTLRIAPTPDALLHPCVWHQAEMVRRVLPHWRIIGTAYLSDIQTAEDVRAVAVSPYHEVRFFDQVRAGTYLHARMSPPMTVEELIGRIRREQSAQAGRTPVLVRLPARAPVAPRGQDAQIPRPSSAASSVES